MTVDVTIHMMITDTMSMINDDDKILMRIVMIINIIMIFYLGTIEYDEMLPWLELLQSGTFSGKIDIYYDDDDRW